MVKRNIRNISSRCLISQGEQYEMIFQRQLRYQDKENSFALLFQPQETHHNNIPPPNLRADISSRRKPTCEKKDLANDYPEFRKKIEPDTKSIKDINAPDRKRRGKRIGKPPTEQRKKRVRSDPHNISGNISSTGVRVVSLLLRCDKQEFINFLKVGEQQYSQLFLVFAYLFFCKRARREELVNFLSLFKKQMLNYFEQRRYKANQLEEEKRETLIKKIEAHTDLLNYLFGLRGSKIDFEKLEALGRHLFQGTQKKVFDIPFEAVRKLHQQIKENIRYRHQINSTFKG